MDSRVKTFFRIAPCLLAIIVDYTGLGLVYPLVSVMFTETGVDVFPHIRSVAASDFYLGLAFLLYPLGMFFGASFLGNLSDVYGRKKILEWSLIGIFLSFVLMGIGVFYHLLFIFLAGRLLSGLMAGSQPLSQAAIADVSSAENKAQNMGLIILTNCVGVILGPLIAGVFSEQLFIRKIGFSIPFFVGALLALFAFFWIFFGFKETFTLQKKRKIEWSRPFIIFLDAFRNPRIRLLSIVTLLFQLGLAIFYQTMAIYLIHNFHYSSFRVGIFYGYMGVLFAIAILWFYPYLLKRLPLTWMAFLGILGNGIFQVILGLIESLPVIWLWLIPLTFANVVGYTSLLTVFSNHADRTRQGWIMGIFGAMVATGFILSGLTANLLIWISSSTLIILGGFVIIISSLLLISFLERKKLSSVFH